jgi:hypothetical protein
VEIWLICVSVAILGANMIRMAYRLRTGILADATFIDWMLLMFFTAAVIVSVPYCFLKCVGQSHDFWHIIPPFGRR